MNAALPLEPPALQRLTVRGDGLNLAVQRWGRADATPLLLVHGYPDHHGVWLPLIAALAADYQIITYDVRGFGASDKPRQRQAYRLKHLARDLEAVILATSPNRPVHLVAHDWGSIQAWEAVTEPRMQPLLASYTSLSGPCLDHVGHWLRERLAQRRLRPWLQAAGQLLSSWYIAFFHLPLLPELTWRLGLDRAWPWLLQRLEGIAQPQRHTSQRADGIHGVQLYRANFIRRLFRPRIRTTPVPVQLIVALHDRFVRPQLFDDLQRWAPSLTRRKVRAGHWQLLAEPGELAGWLREYVGRIEQQQRR
ncbi:alpha/beta fold hydrolase [Pseudomonas sp. GOM7]|uniref:alpha/beta fold hydrolase n=1 Tax=Pseudomonas sp. GOM7 TaxID=2998079 RepID=UPI00227C2B61|nr:alpha/beta fold hydrolase [Pseudomonas sp. GOM7]WAJ36423.1 alpha/beta fold hydrolase [Pseudomonas sp. GOM7]